MDTHSDLDITVSQTPGHPPVTVFHLVGRLDVTTEAAFRQQAREAHAAGVRHVLLDLKGLEAVTSAGLRAIHHAFLLFTPQEDMKAGKKMTSSEPYKTPYFKLVCPSPQVYYVLNLTGFLYNIPIFSDMQAALDSFQG
jgi:anti-anti-sigma regulatory factor